MDRVHGRPFVLSVTRGVFNCSWSRKAWSGVCGHGTRLYGHLKSVCVCRCCPQSLTPLYVVVDSVAEVDVADDVGYG